MTTLSNFAPCNHTKLGFKKVAEKFTFSICKFNYILKKLVN